ncbi:MAG: bifunctional protein-serine/threonine kinase/phosphatase [Burkholderiales bacterium]|nr:bifunctional protein-serine/threonine kinase/phosphatase [Burkholderiales bacterium]
MAFELDIGFVTLAGRKDSNEDFCAALLPQKGEEGMGSIVAVADGVSAGGMGREAAQTTVTSLVRDYYGTPETWDTTVALDRIIGAQNGWLAGINRRRQPAMGLTTLTALVLRGQSYTLAHVGDSRAYLVRAGRSQQLTQDHVAHHPDLKHQLLRCVGIEDHVVVDYLQGELLVGDVFVLATDGVHGTVRSDVFDKRLCTLVAGSPDTGAQEWCRKLVDMALADGSDDNLTALVVRVQGLMESTLIDAKRLALDLRIPPRLRVGEVLDGWRVVQTVADNGINVLYQVKEDAPTADNERLYVLKTLNPARAHDAEERAMLAHEAWLAQRMQSGRAAAHLVNVHLGLANAQARSAFYLLYEWHAGETLEQLLHKAHRLGVQQAVSAAAQTAQALCHLHRQCVIHRDIKPANLHLGADGVLRVLDLGVALSGRESEAMRRLHAGTPSFINPEQWGYCAQGGEGPEELPDAQSDLFALGVTLHQLLTGKLPYGEVLPYQKGRYYRDPVAPSRINPEVPMWLDHVVRKAVARDKRQRFETAEEMLLALQRGASRPLTAPAATPLLQRDPAAVWKLALLVSMLFNVLLVIWLFFLPR